MQGLSKRATAGHDGRPGHTWLIENTWRRQPVFIFLAFIYRGIIFIYVRYFIASLYAPRTACSRSARLLPFIKRARHRRDTCQAAWHDKKGRWGRRQLPIWAMRRDAAFGALSLSWELMARCLTGRKDIIRILRKRRHHAMPEPLIAAFYATCF